MSRDDCCEDRRCDCLHFRQNWTQGSIYKPGEAVSYEGSSYAALHLNQNDPPPGPNWATIAARGPQGPGGPAGPPGAMGPPGLAGASDLYVFQAGRPADVNLGSDGQDIATLRVPAGSYLVMAAIRFTNMDTDDQNWSFVIRLDGAGLASASGRAQGEGGGGLLIAGDAKDGHATLFATATTPNGGTLLLRGNGYSIHVNLGGVQLIAAKVGVIHPQS